MMCIFFHFASACSREFYNSWFTRKIIQWIYKNKHRCKRKDLTIVVEDNGVGMDEQTLQMINSRLYQCISRENRNKNTIERIKLFYGENYGLRVQSQREGDQGRDFSTAMRKGESV